MNMASYRIPFIYQIAGIRRGGRKVEPFLFGAWADVQIPSVASGEAPVSMSWSDRHPDLGIHPRQTRWFEEANWEPVDLGSPDRAAVPLRAGDFHRLREIEKNHAMRNVGTSPIERLAKATGQDYYDLSSFLLGGNSSHGIVEFDPSDMRETLWSGRAEAEALLEDKARELLFVDGDLWIKGGEPHYGIRRTPAGGVVVVPDEGIHRNYPAYHSSFFRADRLDDAIDFARREYGADDVRIASRIEVFIPEAVQFDAEGELLERTARQAIDKGMRFLRTCSTEQALAWIALRDCHGRKGGDHDELAERLREYGNTTSNPTIALPVARTMRRWDMRPMKVPEFAP